MSILQNLTDKQAFLVKYLMISILQGRHASMGTTTVHFYVDNLWYYLIISILMTRSKNWASACSEELKLIENLWLDLRVLRNVCSVSRTIIVSHSAHILSRYSF